MRFEVIKGRIETNISLKVHNFIVGILLESLQFPIPTLDSSVSKKIFTLTALSDPDHYGIKPTIDIFLVCWGTGALTFTLKFLNPVCICSICSFNKTCFIFVANLKHKLTNITQNI
jgi:hypothetical protein